MFTLSSLIVVLSFWTAQPPRSAFPLRQPAPGTAKFEQILEEMRKESRMLKDFIELEEVLMRGATGEEQARRRATIASLRAELRITDDIAREFVRIHEQCKDNPGLVTSAQLDRIDRLIEEMEWVVHPRPTAPPPREVKR